MDSGSCRLPRELEIALHGLQSCGIQIIGVHALDALYLHTPSPLTRLQQYQACACGFEDLIVRCWESMYRHQVREVGGYSAHASMQAVMSLVGVMELAWGKTFSSRIKAYTHALSPAGGSRSFREDAQQLPAVSLGLESACQVHALVTYAEAKPCTPLKRSGWLASLWQPGPPAGAGQLSWALKLLQRS